MKVNKIVLMFMAAAKSNSIAAAAVSSLTDRGLQASEQDFLFVGIGKCKDASGNVYDNGEVQRTGAFDWGVTNIDCMNYCHRFDTSNLVGYYFDSYRCRCAYEDGMIATNNDPDTNGAWPYSQNWLTGTGPVQGAGADSDGYGGDSLCYAYMFPTYDVSLYMCTGDLDNLAATCDYAISPGNANVRSEMFGSDCSSQAPPGFSIASGATGTASGSVHNINIAIDPTAILDDALNSVQFCIKTSVENPESEIMKYHQHLLTVNFDMDGSFSVGTEDLDEFTEIGPDADLGTKTYGVTASHCNPDLSPYTGGNLVSGENLNICIETDDVGVVVDTIRSLTLSKNGHEIPAISNGSPDSVTFVIGKGTAVALVVTRLGSDFFESAGPVTVSGDAVVKFDGRRQLADDTDLSSAGNDESATAFSDYNRESAFELEIGVEPIVPSITSSAARSTISLVFTLGLAALYVI